MPIKTTKKPAKTTAKKATAKTATKALTMKTKTAKTEAKVTHSHAPHGGHHNGHKTGFMWKLLEQKEQALKKTQDGEHKTNPNPHDNGFQPHERDKSFSKFQGPRRKIG